MVHVICFADSLLISTMASQSCPLARKADLLQKQDNDIVIVSAVRSAITKACL